MLDEKIKKKEETIREKEKRHFYERSGYILAQIRIMLEQDEYFEEIVTERDKQVQMQEQQNEIDDTRYNERYQTWQVPSPSRYLKRINTRP